MANFNTYQTRQFYVAKAIKATIGTADDASPAAGDIALKTSANGKAFFSYRNADGLLAATDVFDPKNITSLRYTAAAEMDIPLRMHTITVDTAAVTLSNLVGKVINLTVNIHQVISYDLADSMSVVASVVGDATNTASAIALYRALAKALVNVMPPLPEAPFRVFIGSTEVTKKNDISSATGDFKIVQNPQKYIRGKMSNEPYELSVNFNIGGLSDEDIVWGNDVVANSNVSGLTSIPSVYALADLEAFALGERGNVYRYGLEPNYVPPTYMIDLSKQYNVLSIEYYWQGGAENVQKSPRMIQIAAEAADSDDVVTTLYEALVALVNEDVSASS